MFSLARYLLAGILGAGGISVTSTSLYASPSTNLFKKLWKRELPVAETVMECEDHGHTYRVLMKMAEKGETELGLGVTFKVLKKIGEEQESLIPWGNKAIENNDWSDFKVTYSEGNKYGIFFKNIEDRAYQSYNQLFSCKTSQFESVSKRVDEQDGVAATSIKFEVDEESCKWGLTTAECNLKIADGIDLRWKSEFKPKMKFSAF